MRTNPARTAALAAAFACWAPAAAAAPPGLAACRASTSAEALLLAPSDPELLDYAACSELISGRSGLCDGFPGGPSSGEKPVLEHEIVFSDGSVHLNSPYAVCVSRAAAYRFLSLLVQGAPDEQLRPLMRLLLYGETQPVDEVLKTYVGAYRTGSLEGLARPDLAKIGFFNHVLGAAACKTVRPPGLRRECYAKAAALAAIRAKDPALCLEKDFLCRALVQGPEVCAKIGERIVGRFCERRLPKPVKLTSPPLG